MSNRHSRSFLTLVFMVAIILSMVIAPVSYAQGPGEDGPTDLPTPLRPSVDLNRPAFGTFQTQGDQDFRPFALRAEEGPITALIVLEGEPAAATSAQYAYPNSPAANAAALSRVEVLRASQMSFSSGLAASYDIQTVANLTRLTNALVVNMDASQIEAVKALPGVKDVIPDQIGYLDNANSVPFINTVSAWAAGAGYTGDGMRIGIIDSGIDYTHVNFGGSGDTGVVHPQFNGASTNDPAIATDNIGGDATGFDNSKVVGGYDFVGEGWTGGALLGSGGTPRVPGGWAGPANPFGVGDPDPIDCNGHGSHVAGTAAGFGVVDATGATYAGPWDATTDFNAMRIGPGVAPEAELYALRIGGCTSSVSFVAASLALEFAMDPDGDGSMDDRLDVINNSYGGAYGSAAEALTQEFNLAAANDVMVVGSAGNSGDTYYVNGDPTVAEAALSVASSINDSVYLGLELTTGPAGVYPSYPTTIPANPSQGGSSNIVGPAPLLLVGGTGNSQGCAEADYAAFTGNEIGLIVWDDSPSGCGSGTRMTNAVNAGGVLGLVVVSADPADFPFINLACTYEGGPSTIPCVSITGDDGANLAAAPGDYTVTFDPGLTATLSFSVGDMLSSFTSRGPGGSGGITGPILKPDVAAPGDSIVSTGAGSGNGTNTYGGTSMAAPHVAGMAALLRQAHPDWSVADIKAVIMNTATHDLWTDAGQTGDNYGVSRVGAGRVDVRYAFMSDVVAYDADYPERVSVSYGLVEVVDPVSINRTITVENKGASSRTYDVTFQQMNDMNGAAFSVSPSSITVPAGGTRTVTVTLTADPALMSESQFPDPTTSPVQTGLLGTLPRHWLREEGGYVVLTENAGSPVAPSAAPIAGTPTLRIPVHAIVRPTSAMGSENVLEVDETGIGTGTIELMGQGVDTGFNTPYDVVSLVSPFELIYFNETPTGSYIDSAVIKYVGITSDYAFWLEYYSGDVDLALADTTFYIAVVTHDDWSPASGFDTWFDIGIDVNEDGGYDFTAFNFETGFLAGADFTDTVMSWLGLGGSWLFGDTNSVGISGFINDWDAGSFDTYVMDNNVMVFPVSNFYLGLDSTNTDFNFDILTLKNFFIIDWIPYDAPYWFSYDPTTAPYSFNDATNAYGAAYPFLPTYIDAPGNFIPVDYNLSDYVGLAPEGPQLQGTSPYPEIMLVHFHNEDPVTTDDFVVAQFPGDEPAEDGEGEAADGEGVYQEEWTGADAGTEAEGVTSLPSTGYPPSETESQSSNTGLLFVVVAGALAFVVTLGAVVIRRKRA